MRWLVPLLVGICLSTSAAAEDFWAEGYDNSIFIGFSYSIAVPLSDTRDFISNTSFRGLGFDWRKAVRPSLTVGFHAGWNALDENTTETVDIPGGNLTGSQFRYINAFPILGTAHYYWGRHRGVRPFLGGGLGAYRVLSRIDVGVFQIEEKSWHFGLAPEAGLVFPLTRSSHWFLATTYNHAFEAGDAGTLSYWSFNIGLAAESYGF